EDGIRGRNVTGLQTCALPICSNAPPILLTGGYMTKYSVSGGACNTLPALRLPFPPEAFRMLRAVSGKEAFRYAYGYFRRSGRGCWGYDSCRSLLAGCISAGYRFPFRMRAVRAD